MAGRGGGEREGENGAPPMTLIFPGKRGELDYIARVTSVKMFSSIRSCVNAVYHVIGHCHYLTHLFLQRMHVQWWHVVEYFTMPSTVCLVNNDVCVLSLL